MLRLCPRQSSPHTNPHDLRKNLIDAYVRQLACKQVQFILPTAAHCKAIFSTLFVTKHVQIILPVVKQFSRPCNFTSATSLRPRRQRDSRPHNERLVVRRPQDHRRRHGGQVQQQVEGLPREPRLHAHRLEMMWREEVFASNILSGYFCFQFLQPTPSINRRTVQVGKLFYPSRRMLAINSNPPVSFQNRHFSLMCLVISSFFLSRSQEEFCKKNGPLCTSLVNNIKAVTVRWSHARAMPYPVTRRPIFTCNLIVQINVQPTR